MPTIKCPSCSEQIQDDASICPHCRQAVFSQDKAKNAAAGIIWSVVFFFVMYFLLTQFTSCEANRMMHNLGIH